MMTTRIAAGTLVAPIIFGAARVALGLLWLNEGIIKYRAGFGSADILLVSDGASNNSRVPEFFQGFASNVLGELPGLFGFVMPLLEVGLGIALILGVLTLPAAVGTLLTLMMYWLSDQLTWQYPVMVLLSTAILLWPLSASKLSLISIVLSRAPTAGTRPINLVDSRLRRWI